MEGLVSIRLVVLITKVSLTEMIGSPLCCITLTCFCYFLPASNRVEDEVFKATWFIIVMVAIAILILVIIIVCLLLKRNRGDKYNGEVYSFCYRGVCDIQITDCDMITYTYMMMCIEPDVVKALIGILMLLETAPTLV